MKKMKHFKVTIAKMISVCMAAIIILAVMPTAAAASYLLGPPVSTASVLGEGVTPAADDTEWIYRFYEGKWQMRLWSNAESRWLTDWIDCN